MVSVPTEFIQLERAQGQQTPSLVPVLIPLESAHGPVSQVTGVQASAHLSRETGIQTQTTVPMAQARVSRVPLDSEATQPKA